MKELTFYQTAVPFFIYIILMFVFTPIVINLIRWVYKKRK